MRIALTAVAAALIFVLAMAVYIRFSPMEPARWQTSPDAARKSGKPNDYLLLAFGTAAADLARADGEAAVYAVDATGLARLIEEVALAEPRTKRIAGDWMLGSLTFVQRSRLIGFPDAISVETRDLGDETSTVSIYSRSRFGDSDFGVNKARIDRWLGAIALFLVQPQPSR